jgi:hypothetical protein
MAQNKRPEVTVTAPSAAIKNRHRDREMIYKKNPRDVPGSPDRRGAGPDPAERRTLGVRGVLVRAVAVTVA